MVTFRLQFNYIDIADFIISIIFNSSINIVPKKKKKQLEILSVYEYEIKMECAVL